MIMLCRKRWRDGYCTIMHDICGRLRRRKGGDVFFDSDNVVFGTACSHTVQRVHHKYCTFLERGVLKGVVWLLLPVLVGGGNSFESTVLLQYSSPMVGVKFLALGLCLEQIKTVDVPVLAGVASTYGHLFHNCQFRLISGYRYAGPHVAPAPAVVAVAVPGAVRSSFPHSPPAVALIFPKEMYCIWSLHLRCFRVEG